MTKHVIEPDAQGDFLAPQLGIWPRELCGATRSDTPDLPCVLPPHLDGEHEDERGEDFETVEAFTELNGARRG